jgi:hypothetical protein
MGMRISTHGNSDDGGYDDDDDDDDEDDDDGDAHNFLNLLTVLRVGIRLYSDPTQPSKITVKYKGFV